MIGEQSKEQIVVAADVLMRRAQHAARVARAEQRDEFDRVYGSFWKCGEPSCGAYLMAEPSPAYAKTRLEAHLRGEYALVACIACSSAALPRHVGYAAPDEQP
jgi:hypothetical protein